MLFGLDDKKELLTRLISKNRLSHAYLFFGEPEVGKFSLAEWLARQIEKKNETEILLDSQFIFPNEKSIIGIDESRKIKQFLWQTPLGSNKRVVVIDRAEEMTPEAAAAMLRIVEEPPQHALIIFIANNETSLLPPLLSRLTKIYFSRVADEQMLESLILNFQLKKEKAEIIVKKSFGRWGRAMRLITGSDLEPIVATLETDSGAQILVGKIEKDIMNLWQKDKIKNASKIKWLLTRADLINQYNLNSKLQEKAVEWKMTGN